MYFKLTQCCMAIISHKTERKKKNKFPNDCTCDYFAFGKVKF